MRRSPAVLLAAIALAGCGGDAGELLPDLAQARPEALQVVPQGGRYLLTFLSAVDNVGAGPLVLESRRASRSEPVMTIRQLVRRADGSEASYAVRGEVRFVRSETHRHWHVLGFERYELRTLDGRLVAPDRKTGFCLGDRYETDRASRLPGEPARPVWTRKCGRGQPGLLVLR